MLACIDATCSLFCRQIAPQVLLTDEEISSRMAHEYAAFVAEETIFLRELGLLKDESLEHVESGGDGL